jgi:hypothetical protein
MTYTSRTDQPWWDDESRDESGLRIGESRQQDEDAEYERVRQLEIDEGPDANS